MATTCVDEDALTIRHQALAYRWHEGAFLTRAEAKYALERLWALCAGTTDWSNQTVLSLPAVTREDVVRMHRLDGEAMAWIPLEAVLPSGHSLALDTDRLPALCPSAPGEVRRFSPPRPFPLDLVAATFVMLTRWEETEISCPPDKRGNYRERCQLAARHGFADRPVLDEWALVLRTWLSAQRPSWKARARAGQIVMTHDVDAIRKFTSWYRVPRAAAGTLLRTGSVRRAWDTVRVGVRSRPYPTRDPYYRGVRSLLDFDESLGARGTFFLMAADRGPFDTGYDPEAAEVRSLVDEVLRRGHDVGWHPGYRAAEDRDLFLREKRRIDACLGRPVRAARFHYLRWRPRSAWRWLVQAGIASDSTLGFNEAVGFRCGTAHPFPVWDRSSQEELPLVESPLVIQDGTLLTYLGLGPADASRRIGILRERVRRVGGDLTILIHNAQPGGIQRVLEVFGQGLR